MLPGPATFLLLFRAVIHLMLGVYFLVVALRSGTIGRRLVFVLCVIVMALFAYQDFWQISS